jgi:hypothetical protein
MIVLENISTSETYDGDDLEYFVDDDTLIGEVYLDGNLIHQATDVVDEHQLEADFYQHFETIRDTSDTPDIFQNDDMLWD